MVSMRNRSVREFRGTYASNVQKDEIRRERVKDGDEIGHRVGHGSVGYVSVYGPDTMSQVIPGHVQSRWHFASKTSCLGGIKRCWCEDNMGVLWQKKRGESGCCGF